MEPVAGVMNALGTFIERRASARIEMPFPARVRGTNQSGEKFDATALVENLSACGLYTRLAYSVSVGTKLLVTVCLSTSGQAESQAPRVALRGKVVRVDPHGDGSYGVALAFRRYRFLYALQKDDDAGKSAMTKIVKGNGAIHPVERKEGSM